MYENSQTVNDFVTGVINNVSSLQMQNLWHAPVASSSQTHFLGASRINIENNRNSRTVSDNVISVRDTGFILSGTFPNNARSSLQMQTLWNVPTTSSSHTMHFPGNSRINLVENSTYQMFVDQYTNFSGCSSSALWDQ